MKVSTLCSLLSNKTAADQGLPKSAIKAVAKATFKLKMATNEAYAARVRVIEENDFRAFK